MLKKYFTVIVLIASCLTGLSQENKELYKYNTIYIDSEVDSMPSYPGGEEALYLFIQDNTRTTFFMDKETPQMPSGNNEYVLVASFIINEKGEISDINFLQSEKVSVEQQVLKAIKIMPKWNPAKNDGTAVSCRIYIPIRYVIIDNQFYVTNLNKEMVVGYTKKTNVLKYSIMAATITFFGLLFLGIIKF